MMTQQNPYSQASQAYKQAEQHNLNGYEISAKLHNGILKNLHDAKKLFESTSIEEMAKVNANTFEILEALQVNLNFEDESAKETSEFLYRFYNIVFIKVAEILEQEDPGQQFQDLINYVKPVCERWEKMAIESNKASTKELAANPSDIEPVDIQE